MELPAGQESIACRIQDQEQLRQREAEVAILFKGATRIQEIVDGYALCFPGEESWATRLMAFILFERECCPFLTFELTFEPQRGPIWLRLRGPEGIKEGLWSHVLQAHQHMR
ncbi:MAG TPA: hypothetical protein VL485_16760 [Ktedonobacteraceae bacterium]|jgi:hypothetical protein|nr:hypothetical protein [Ktedonobacteraceae bacterium]